MSCPHCHCKETYVNNDDDGCTGIESDLRWCANCGAIFPLEDEANEDDFLEDLE